MNDLIKQIVESKFNFNIDTENNERQDSLSKSKYNSVSLKELYALELYTVDLNLPSGTRWCRYNLGVDINLLDKAEDWYGDYYAWGEIETKDDYDETNYKYAKNKRAKDKLIKYCHKAEFGYKKYVDNLIELLLEDDAAYLNMHLLNYKFRIPSKDLFEELLEYTNNEWVENYNDINKLNGIIFSSKTNNNEMFIPAAGYFELNLYDVNTIFGLRLWTSTLYNIHLWSSNMYVGNPLNAWMFGTILKKVDISPHARNLGLSIRPVLYL